MMSATLPAMLGTEYLRLLEAKDEVGIFDLLADDAQIVDELTRRWVRGRHPIGVALREFFTRVTDVQATAEDVHVMRWGDTQVETFTLHLVYDLDEASCWSASPTTLIWHRIGPRLEARARVVDPDRLRLSVASSWRGWASTATTEWPRSASPTSEAGHRRARPRAEWSA